MWIIEFEWMLSGLFRRIFGRAALTLGMIVTGLGFATPALAASTGSEVIHIDLKGWNYQAFVNNDNNTIRLSSRGRGFHIDFYEYNTGPDMFQLYVNADQAYIWYLPQPVSEFRICGPNIWGGDVCSHWHPLDQ